MLLVLQTIITNMYLLFQSVRGLQLQLITANSSTEVSGCLIKTVVLISDLSSVVVEDLLLCRFCATVVLSLWALVWLFLSWRWGRTVLFPVCARKIRLLTLPEKEIHWNPTTTFSGSKVQRFQFSYRIFTCVTRTVFLKSSIFAQWYNSDAGNDEDCWNRCVHFVWPGTTATCLHSFEFQMF